MGQGDRMKERSPFTAADLAEMDMLILDRATQVIAMEDVYEGNRDPRAVALRHDVDASNPRTAHALDTAVKMAEWEAARGYRSTYYILHTAPYWDKPGFREQLEQIANHGHEIGVHANCLAEALRTGRDPDMILDEALAVLRGYGHTIRGVAGHGDPFCNRDRNIVAGEVSCANDEQFVECARPQEGRPDRIITRGRIALALSPRPLADFGLEYEALKLAYDRPKILPFRISDSGGRWLNPGWEETVVKWNYERALHPHVDVPSPDVRQLHMLIHPDWWNLAFVPSKVPA